MAVFPAIFFLFLHFSVIFGYRLNTNTNLSDEENKIVWPTEYHFNGEELDFTTTIKTPFETWYSDELQRSRIDYHEGSVKEYYDANKGYAKFTVSPIAQTNMTSTMNCTRVRTPRYLKGHLPYASSLNYTGEQTNFFGKVVEVWASNSHYGFSETLYAYKTDSDYYIPVQLISKQTIKESGEVKSFSITNYYNFRSSVSEEELTTDEPTCLDLDEEKGDLKTNLNKDSEISQNLNIAFDNFAKHHTRQYQENEILQRREIFEKNWRMVQEHNSKNLGFKLELNAFSDRTPEELLYLTGSVKNSADDAYDEALPFPHTDEEIEDILQELPEEFDLRIEGCVTSVKHQAACGSCWAFAATGTLEGALARVNGKLLDLSEQYLVDCTWTYGSNGCHGGYARDALKLVTDYGIPTERDYGLYKAKDGYCNILNMTNTYKIKGFVRVTPLNPAALKVALYKYGPVAIRIHTDPIMMHYKNGIFYNFYCEENSKINHALVAVGYGTRDGEDYWIVKNSWGEVWGEDGYILMSARNNNCLVLNEPLFILV